MIADEERGQAKRSVDICLGTSGWCWGEDTAGSFYNGDAVSASGMAVELVVKSEADVVIGDRLLSVC